MIRAARERQGLHIAALAAAIKVAPRKLDALENDRWQELPDATFVRALAQTVCRTLKIDARPVLERLPAAGAVALEPISGVLNEPFRDRPGREESAYGVAAVRPMVWAAAALMAAAVAVYFLPAGLWGGDKATVVSQAVSTPVAPLAAASATALPASAPASASDGLAGAVVTAVDATAPAAVAAAPVPVATGEIVFSAPPSTLAVAALAAGILQLRASEASWVEVRDARNQLLLSRVVQPGESVGLDGALPLHLIVGNAAATQLVFRGQPVELASRTRENVARLDLP